MNDDRDLVLRGDNFLVTNDDDRNFRRLKALVVNSNARSPLAALLIVSTWSPREGDSSQFHLSLLDRFNRETHHISSSSRFVRVIADAGLSRSSTSYISLIDNVPESELLERVHIKSPWFPQDVRVVKGEEVLEALARLKAVPKGLSPESHEIAVQITRQIAQPQLLKAGLEAQKSAIIVDPSLFALAKRATFARYYGLWRPTHIIRHICNVLHCHR